MRVARVVAAVEQDGELVAAEPRGEVAGRRQARRRRAKATSSSSPTPWPRLSLTP